MRHQWPHVAIAAVNLPPDPDFPFTYMTFATSCAGCGLTRREARGVPCNRQFEHVLAKALEGSCLDWTPDGVRIRPPA